jgi:hypothetical protein
LFRLSLLIGIIAAFADQFATACCQRRFSVMKRQWQTANWTLAEVDAVWLHE